MINQPVRPVVREYGPDPAQFGEVWLPSVTPAATVVIVHGGFWRARYDLSLGLPARCGDLAQRGYAVWNLEYRRVGAGGGLVVTFEDIAAGIDVLAELPAATTRVAAIGHSAGGHLAAGRPGGRGCRPGPAPGARPLVAVSAVTSVEAVVLALAWECDCERVRGARRSSYPMGWLAVGPARSDEWPSDPIAVARSSKGRRARRLHSRSDGAVPFAYSERYAAAATRAGGRARLHETDGDHFTLIDPHSADWRMAANALPGLRSLPSGHPGPGRGEADEDVKPAASEGTDR